MVEQKIIAPIAMVRNVQKIAVIQKTLTSDQKLTIGQVYCITNQILKAIDSQRTNDKCENLIVTR